MLTLSAGNISQSSMGLYNEYQDILMPGSVTSSDEHLNEVAAGITKGDTVTIRPMIDVLDEDALVLREK